MSDRSGNFNVYIYWVSDVQNSQYNQMLEQNNPVNGTLYESYNHS
jgi:hypothetical protein